MEKYFAGFFSVFFQPLLIPSYAFLILFYSNTLTTGVMVNNYLYLLIPLFIMTFAMPLIFLLYFRYRKIISSLHLKNRKERTLPYVITFVFFFASYYSLKSIHTPGTISFFILGSTIIIAIAFIVNIWWKISAHMIALGGLTGLLLSLSIFAKIDLSPYLLFVILISGLTAYARLYEKAHTSAQVYVGYLSGIAIMSALFYLSNF